MSFVLFALAAVLVASLFVPPVAALAGVALDRISPPLAEKFTDTTRRSQVVLIVGGAALFLGAASGFAGWFIIALALVAFSVFGGVSLSSNRVLVGVGAAVFSLIGGILGSWALLVLAVAVAGAVFYTKTHSGSSQ